MAKITERQRRLVASGVAFILTAAMMMPTTTDARGGGGGSFGGHGGGAHFGFPGTVRTAGPSVAGPATVRRAFASSPRHFVVSSRIPFSHRRASFRHAHRIGSHFFTLGADGIWGDSLVYAPTVLVTQQPVLIQQPQPIYRRAAEVITPNAVQAGIVVVRGDTKSYVTFPSPQGG